MKSLESKTALIFGASGGIGFELAKQLKRAGATVYAAQRNECLLEGVKSITADVRNNENIEQAVLFVKSEVGFLDFLIYNSAHSMAGPLEYILKKDLDAVLETNLLGAINAIQYSLPLMKEKGGKIILVSSIGGVVPIAFDAPYSITKSGLNILAKELNVELSPFNIRVCSILVGGTRTPFTNKRRYYDNNECKEYFEKVKNAYYALAEIEQKGDSADFVSEKILKILLKQSPKPVIAIGLKNKIFNLSYEILPQKLSQFIIKKVFRQ